MSSAKVLPLSEYDPDPPRFYLTATVPETRDAGDSEF
jgi:hypothetical protein